MKPELLAPAGTIESFWAAIEGGADAVYLGLNMFNARMRAKNFSLAQLPALMQEAKKHNIKVYLTLNTIIKNAELPKIIEYLYALSHYKPDAIIIQDWGVFHLLTRFFPNLAFHASTQMGVHNSVYAQYLYEKGFSRIITARELTFSELYNISTRTSAELEIFVHGALCYCFSGSCLFSSFLGGKSANRGNCLQPCRRLYKTGKDEKYFFSLKDLQALEMLPEIMKIGISSLKIEGRLKTPEYVYRVVKAYRTVIDFPERLEEAKKLLLDDMGREKTKYFLGGNINDALTASPYNGLYLGESVKQTIAGIEFILQAPLNTGARIRILPPNGDGSEPVKLVSFQVGGKPKEQAESGEKVFLPLPFNTEPKSKVFLQNMHEHKFKRRLPMLSVKKEVIATKEKKKIIKYLKNIKEEVTEELYLRISSLKWLSFLPADDYTGIILNLNRKELLALTLQEGFIVDKFKKIILEMPLFIPEEEIDFYREKMLQYARFGINRFMISQLGQKLILPQIKNLEIYTNENIYVTSDATAKFLEKEGTTRYLYAYENDAENYREFCQKGGIVPLYYHPALFYSRFPIEIADNEKFADRVNNYRKITKNAMTIIYPEKPVSLFGYRKKFQENGFKRFLIDLSQEQADTDNLKKIMTLYRGNRDETQTNQFNLQKGLK